MRNLLLGISILALLIGCSSKEEERFLKIYEKNKNYHQQLQKTEKVQLFDGEYSKVLLTATYLFTPSKDQNDIRDEKFIVGVHFENEESAFANGAYTLTLDSAKPISVKRLSRRDPLLKHISFVSDWTEFYLFTFPHTKSKSFTLLLQSTRYGKGELHFAKVAKYVLSKDPLQ